MRVIGLTGLDSALTKQTSQEHILTRSLIAEFEVIVFVTPRKARDWTIGRESASQPKYARSQCKMHEPRSEGRAHGEKPPRLRLPEDVRIDHRRSHIPVAEEFLDRADVRARLQ